MPEKAASPDGTQDAAHRPDDTQAAARRPCRDAALLRFTDARGVKRVELEIKRVERNGG